MGRAEDQRYFYIYPLREYHMDRLACMETILEAGLPLPIKSACYMCPASKPQELIWLHAHHPDRSEEHTSELQSLMRISYAVFCLQTNKRNKVIQQHI